MITDMIWLVLLRSPFGEAECVIARFEWVESTKLSSYWILRFSNEEHQWSIVRARGTYPRIHRINGPMLTGWRYTYQLSSISMLLRSVWVWMYCTQDLVVPWYVITGKFIVLLYTFHLLNITCYLWDNASCATFCQFKLQCLQEIQKIDLPGLNF